MTARTLKNGRFGGKRALRMFCERQLRELDAMCTKAERVQDDLFGHMTPVENALFELEQVRVALRRTIRYLL